MTNIKVKIKVNKLSHNPLFIKFLNWSGDKFTIENLLKGLQDSFELDSDKDTVKSTLLNLDESYLSNLDNFKKKFVSYVFNTITNQNASEEFLAWLSNSYKYIEEEIDNHHNNEIRKVHIKDPEGRWFESLICYNFIMTFNNFGVEIIKKCPCSKFFSHKGKYAKYCSEECKSKGMKK